MAMDRSDNPPELLKNPTSEVVEKQGRPDFWNDARPTNENPNFVHDYFQSSRLHFIGSFRARYESMMVSVGKRLSVNPGMLLQNSVNSGLQACKKKSSQRVIVHIDMDAFFASVAVRDDPSLVGLPIAVCHAAGEISSCSYEARECGVRAGMYLRDARQKCPNLRSVPYDFDAYEKVSVQIYSRFFQYPHVCVEAVSVDEAYLDLTLSCTSEADDKLSVMGTAPSSQSAVEDLVSDLRTRIFEDTKCTASAGIGPSKLVARLATKAAKPNGQFRVHQKAVISYLDTLKIRDLPGIGWRTSRKFDELGVSTVPQLRRLPLSTLQREFGDRQGTVFHDLARAVDARPVEPLKPRKSIGAEVSWGVRFLKDETEKVNKFIADLAEEVALRVIAAGAYGTKVTYKIYKRIRNVSTAGYKTLGHGPCTILTRSGRLPHRVVGDALKHALKELCLRIHADVRIEHEDFRGVGIQVGDLTFADLKFDHASMPAAGTRRIETFFKSSNVESSATVPLLGAPNQTQTGRSRTNIGQKDGVSGVNASAQLVETDNQSIKYHAHASRSNNIAEVGEYNSDDDDRIEKRPALPTIIGDENGSDGEDRVQKRVVDVVKPLSEGIRRNEESANKANGDSQRQSSMMDWNVVETVGKDPDAVKIPDGWDTDVFKQLPNELQKELLKQPTSSNPPEARRRLQFPTTHANATNRPWKKLNVRTETMAALANGKDRSLKRKKQGAQVTLTQFAEISELRKTGTDVLNATEFRERPLRECVELLEDLKGVPTLGGSGHTDIRKEVIANDTDRRDMGVAEEWNEIPSPPCLSSDSDGAGSVSEKLQKYNGDATQVYADEETWIFASDLKDWMQVCADDIKSAHVELLRGRLMELLRNKRLTSLCDMLRTISVFALDKGCEPWVVWFDRLVTEVQSECMKMYKFRLSIWLE